MTTPFIRTLSDIRVLELTSQLLPNTQFLIEVFSKIVVLSPTAHCDICVDLIVLPGAINGGACIFVFSDKSPNNFSQYVKILKQNSFKLNSMLVN